MSATRQATRLLENLAAAAAGLAPEDRLVKALGQYIDIPLRQVADMIGVTPQQAQETVANLLKSGKVQVVMANGVKSVRRSLPG